MGNYPYLYILYHKIVKNSNYENILCERSDEMTDIEIARNTKLNPITEIAKDLGIKENELEQYGKYKAKINEEAFED